MTENSAQPPLVQLAEGLEKEAVLYEEMAALAGRQIEALKKGDAAEAAAVLEEKGARMAEIDAVEKVIGPAKKEWPATRGAAEAAVRERIEAAAASIEEKLKRILSRENEIQELIGNARKSTVEDIIKARNARSAGQAYLKGGGGRKPEARFFDDKQ